MIRYLLMALLLAVPVSAWAHVQLELGAGVSHAGIRSNGTWYQQGLPYTLKTESPALEINLRWQIKPNLDLVTGVVDLGRYSSDSLDNPSDAAYAAHVSLPLAHYVGSGRLWGLQVLLEHRWGDRWQVGVKGGLILYRESWRMDVPDWYPSDPVGVPTWYTPRETVGGYHIGPIVPIHTVDQRWAVGAIVGVTLSHRDWPVALSLEYVKDGAKFSGHPGGWPPLWTDHLVALVSYRF
jgi:hypothetical protein